MLQSTEFLECTNQKYGVVNICLLISINKNILITPYDIRLLNFTGEEISVYRWISLTNVSIRN